MLLYAQTISLQLITFAVPVTVDLVGTRSDLSALNVLLEQDLILV